MSKDYKIRIQAELDTEKAKEDLDKFAKQEKEIKYKAKVDTSEIDEINKKMKPKKAEFKATVSGTEKISKMKKDIDGAKRSADGLTDSFKNISKVGLQIDLFQEIEKQAKNAVQAIEDIDKAIVSLQMATNASYDNMRTLMSDYNTIAKDMGAITTEVAKGADDWLRQGESIANTNKLVKDSMVLSKVAEIDSETSTKQLTAMMKGYKKTVDEVSQINDALTSIDLAAAVDAGGLAEATSRVAASADLAGVSLNRLLGYEAAVGEASQEGMSVIGNSFKTIFQRMGDIKAGKLELVDEDGTIEKLSDVELVLDNVGIKLRDSANEFKDFDDVLDDTAKKWETMSGVQQRAVSKAFAGTRQMNRFQLLMENYNKALDYEKIANKSEGTALKKFEDNYLNSIEAKQKSLQASFESLAFNTISRESYAGVIEATTALVEFLDKTNLVKGALAGLTVGGGAKAFLSITNGITEVAMHMQNFQKSLELLDAGNISTESIEKLASYTDGLSKSQLKAIVSSKELTAAQRLQILTASGMDEATAKATLATMGLSTAEAIATTSTISLSTAFKGLFSTLLSNPMFLIGTAVTAGVSVWQSYKKSVEEAVSSAQSAGQNFSENTSLLNDQINKVRELKSALASGTLSEQESAQAKSQLLEIQKKLVSTYGEQAKEIDLVNGSLKEQIALMNELAVKDSNEYLNENKKGIDKARKEMEKNRHFYLGDYEPNTDAGKKLQNIIDKYKELGIVSVIDGGFGSIAFEGNVTDAKDVINDFLTDVRVLSEKTGDKYGFLDGIETYASGELGKVREVIDEYGEIYNSALQADMISKGFGENSPATIYKKYGEAIEEYNNALSSGDTSKIDKAKSSFDKVQSSVKGVLKQYPEYKTLFNELGDTLNESAIQAIKFGDVLKEDKFKGITEQLKALKDVDLLGMNFSDDVTSDAETALKSVVDKAIELGIVSDESSESIAKVVELLVTLGYTGTQSTESLAQSFEKANTSIQNAIANAGKLNDILEESMSGSGISGDSIKIFREMFGEDAENALERTANGYHINKEALAALQKQQEEMTETDYLNALNDQFTALRDIEAQIATAQLFERDTSGLEASRNEILDNISTLEELQYQYEAASSAYRQWQRAMSGGEEGDMYDSIFGNLDKAQELYDKKLTGTNKFKEFTDLISSQDLSNASTDQITTAYEEAIPKIRRYFTEGRDGAERFLEDVHNLNAEWAQMNEDGNWEINFGANNDKEIADKLGIDVEAVQAILRKLSDYGFDINLDQPLASMEELKSQAEQAKEALGDMQVDLNVDSFAEVNGQIEKVKEYIENLNNSEIAPDVRADKLEDANSILEYLLSKKQELGQTEKIDVSIEVDESELNEGYATLSRMKESLETLQGNVRVSADVNNAQSQIDACVAQIESMTPEMKVALGIQGMSVEQIKAGLLDGSITIPVAAETSQAKSDVQSVENQTINQKNFTVTANTFQATTALSSVKSSLASIKSKTVTVTVNRVENNSGVHKLSGTANLSGTAYASGNWGNPQTQTALVGERGREIVVDPHTGHWYTVGDNGTEFAKIPAHAIVFNDIQTEALLKNGKIDGRGKALMSGTAFSSGSGSFGSSSSLKSTSSSKSSKSKSSSKTAAKETEKAVEEVLDWIEILLRRIAKETERAVDAIDTAIGLVNKQSATSVAIFKVQNEIVKQQQAYNAYLSKANSLGLNSDYISKIQNGSLSIENIANEDLKKKIEDYKKWYEEAEKCKDSIDDLKKKESELNQQRLKNVEEWHDSMIDINKAMIDVAESKQELNEKLGTAINLEVNTNELKNAIKAQQDTYNQLVQKLADYQKEFNSQVSSGAIQKDSEAWFKGQENIQKFTSEIYKASSELIEFQDKLREIEYDTLKNLIDGFERVVSKIDAQIELLEARDEKIPESLYQEQINTNDSQIIANKQLRDKKLAEMSLYDVNSKRYQELAEEINKLDEETLQLMTDNEKLKDSIFELRFDPLNEGIKKSKELRDELNSFYDLLNEDAFFDKNGGGTAELAAGLALIAQGMNAAKQEIKDYQTGLEKLEESFKNGVISEKELEEASAEYTQQIQDTVKDVEKYKDTIIELYMTQMSKENEALQTTINKRKEALKSKEDYYNYDKKIKAQSKDVSMLQAQIKALEGTNNIYSKSKLKRLKEELKQAQETLSDTKREHSVEMQEKGLNAMSEDMNKILEDTEYEIAHSAQKQEEVISSMLNRVVGNYKDAFDKINQIIGNTGWVGSNGFNQNQSQLGSQSGAQSQHESATKPQGSIKPSGNASGTVTTPIPNNGDFNSKFENEIMQKPNTDNRLCAELKLSTTAISIQEGQTAHVTAQIRPTDAKNKTLTWNSSDVRIATASNGTISGLKPGSCQVTVITTDGSGLSASIGVTVTKKPEPPKPAPPANNNTTGADGVPKVGDAVTFASGFYYYDSQGVTPSGGQMRGQTVYITKINSRSWATKPYHISRTSKFGEHDLGWVSLDQLRGYRSGASFIPENQLAITQEDGKEFILRNGSVLTQLNEGDKIMTRQETDNMYNWSKINPGQFAFSPTYDPVPNITPVNNTVIENHYDSLLTIDGGTITKDSIPDMKKLLMDSYKFTSSMMYKDAKKTGLRKR